MEAHLHGVQGAAGSNPVSPTTTTVRNAVCQRINAKDAAASDFLDALCDLIGRKRPHSYVPYVEMKLLFHIAEQFKLMAELLYLYTMKLYLKTLLLCLTIAKDLLGGIIAIGYFRSVALILLSMIMLVWYLTILSPA